MMVISFEGIAGSGKTTISKQVKKRLVQRKLRVLLYRPITRGRLEKALSAFPGKREKVWGVRLPVIPPKAEILSYLALLIKDEKDYLSGTEYDVVIFDRYIDTISSGVFARNNILERNLDSANFYSWVKDTCYKEIRIPDLTLILDLPQSTAAKRTFQRERRRYTRNDRALFGRILDFYKFLAICEPKRLRFIDASRSEYDVLDNCLKEIEKILPLGLK